MTLPLKSDAIQAALRAAGFRNTKKLGQHFLFDRELLGSIADAGEVGEGDCVLEVGTGAGTLTRVLAERATEVVTVEMDRRLESVARRVIGDTKATVLHVRGDALDGEEGLHAEVLAALRAAADRGLQVKCVSNFPYNVATTLVIRMLRLAVAEGAFPLAVFAGTVQLEAAQRWGARVGAANYGAPAVQIQALASVRTVRGVAKRAFWPPPKVESAVVAVTPLQDTGLTCEGWSRYEATCRGLFSYRRKQVRRALRHALDLDGAQAAAILAAAGIDPERRVHDLGVAELRALAAAVEPR